MSKVLVVGFPRSGTSLTLRIFQNNPKIEKTYFEKFILFDKKNKRLKEKISHLSLYEKSFAEKIIWVKRNQGKAYVVADVTGVDYCEHWNKLFGKDSRIINVVRHPVDSWNSLVKLRKKQGRLENIDEQFEWYRECAIEFFEEIPKLKNCFAFKYEDLIMNPNKMIKKLYLFCDLPQVKFEEKMRAKRVFNYKWFGMRNEIENYDFQPIINVLNKIDGVKYE